MIRTAVERLTRGLRYRRSLPKEFGHNPVWVSSSAGLRYLVSSLGAVDPVLLNLAREFVAKGNVVWDIGANVGLFTFASAHLCGSEGLVVAVEPDDSLVRLLGRSAAMQRSSSAPVHVIQAAVARSVDMRTFCMASRSRSANFLKGYGSTQIGGVLEEKTIVTVSLDWLAERLPLPDVLKIDVEGAEAEILIGSFRLLGRKRPILLCEVSAQSSARVTELLLANGYRIYDGEVPGSRPELSAAPWNTVAIPS